MQKFTINFLTINYYISPKIFKLILVFSTIF